MAPKGWSLDPSTDWAEVEMIPRIEEGTRLDDDDDDEVGDNEDGKLEDEKGASRCAGGLSGIASDVLRLLLLEEEGDKVDGDEGLRGGRGVDVRPIYVRSIDSASENACICASSLALTATNDSPETGCRSSMLERKSVICLSRQEVDMAA